MDVRKSIFTLWLLLVAVLTASAQEPLRPQCSAGRHPRKAALLSRRAAGDDQREGLFTGEKRQLVFLAAFNDLTFKEEDPQAFWNKVFNEEQFAESPFHGSVHDYFSAQSYGQFQLHFDLYLVTLPKEHAVYKSGYIGVTPDDSGAGLLLTELLDAAKDDIPDWSVYDWDDDGNVDQVLILFAGKGQNDGGDKTTIWSHQWCLSEQSESPFNREWGHPYTVVSGEKEYIVDRYGAFPELSGSGDYGTFGTLCHEYGHCLGLPDFYYGSSVKVVGSWDIMDYGNYNQGGYCPPGYSAHERMYLGWLDAGELTEPASVKDMAALSERGEAYLIRSDAVPNEFYVVENRQQTGWDASLPGSGVLIFHIDYDEEVWRTGIPNSNKLKRYTLFHANNETFVSSDSWRNWAYPYGENNALTNDSQPAATLNNENIDGTKLMSKPLTGIAVHEGLASFDFMGGATGIRNVNVNDNLNDNLNDKVHGSWFTVHGSRVSGSRVSGGIYVVRDRNGKVKKIVLR